MGDSQVYLRKVESEDIDLLFGWANDHLVRENSFNSDPIPYEDHTAWFERMMNDETVLQFIMMLGSIPIGQIRLNVEGNEAEIGYSISSEYRGKGYGRLILNLLKDEISLNYPNIHVLKARVKPDNEASNRLFITEGFSTDCICYSYNLNSN